MLVNLWKIGHTKRWDFRMDYNLDDLDDLDEDLFEDNTEEFPEDSEYINEAKLNTMKLFTVDPYHDVNFFNKMLVSMTNNFEKYDIFASTKSPFNWK